MVYAAGGGVFHRFARDAVERESIRVVEGEDIRWPLVHAEDLANLYVLARTFAKRFGTRLQEPQIVAAGSIAAELGDWAKGYGLGPAAQRREGAR